MKLKLSAPPQIKIAFAPFIPFVDVRQLLSPKVKGAHVKILHAGTCLRRAIF
jgi:hypothetical protein